MKRLTFLIAIDAYLLRKGIIALLNKIPGISVISETGSADNLKNLVSQHQPDFLVLSTAIFQNASPFYDSDYRLYQKTILILLTNQEPGAPVREVLHVDDTREKLLETLNNLVNPYFRNHGESGDSVLSKREETILRLIARGNTNREIAGQLFLSLHTVTTHRKNIVAKLGIKSVSGLTVYAIVNNIISLEEISSGKEK